MRDDDLTQPGSLSASRVAKMLWSSPDWDTNTQVAFIRKTDVILVLATIVDVKGDLWCYVIIQDGLGWLCPLNTLMPLTKTREADCQNQ